MHRFDGRSQSSQSAYMRIVHVRDCSHYVAVSWRWEDFKHEPKSRVDILDTRQSQAGVLRPIKGPKSLLDRAARFAAAHDARLLWVDQECVDQEDRGGDKEKAIQSMDLVYQGSKFPLGVLVCRELSTQDEVDSLTALMENKPLSTSEWKNVARIMQEIGKNEFFQRAWICQEVACSGGMTLIIPCNPSLMKTETLGSTYGEIEIKLDGSAFGVDSWYMLHEAFKRCEENFGILEQSREAGPLDEFNFCETFDLLENDERSGLWEGYDRLITYTLSQQRWHERDNRAGGVYISESIEDRKLEWRGTRSARSGLDLLADKVNSNASDRLAILSNICNYSVRLNTKSLMDHFTFSQCVLTLTILNNDWSFFDPIDSRYIKDFEDSQSQDVFNTWGASILSSMLRCCSLSTLQQSALHFLCCSKEHQIHEGRLWLITNELDLKEIRQWACEIDLSKPNPAAFSQLFWEIICRCLETNTRPLALSIWHQIMATQKPNESSIEFISHMYDIRGCPYTLISGDLHDRFGWIMEQVRHAGILHYGKCMGQDWNLMENSFALFGNSQVGITIFEPLGREAPWRVRKKIWIWDSTQNLSRGFGGRFAEATDPRAYVLKRFDAGGRLSTA